MEHIKLHKELKIFIKKCTCCIKKNIAENKLEEIETFLNETCSAKNAETVKEYIKEVENEKGEFSQLRLWKLKQKLCPKTGDPPMAKKDEDGNLVISPKLLKRLYLRTYQNRLGNRAMKNELMDVFFLKEELWKSIMEELIKLKSVPRNESQLRKAIKSIKKNKTSDPNGMINEIFMSDVR